ncbi:unnamed protein product [Litomosoides sigmodontis]|uniref:GST N-terminal domain-containing protein n=1 Tax=Litomosoides sigmodontis TaxID=42156 RepID=A0A3P6TDC8_LITSI|nr:unnamed protein product [Litomosoides sigmodontis]
MSMPKFKLYNSSNQRCGKLAKLIFKIANVPYEDISINQEEQWDAIRNETPLGTLPILEIDGIKLGGQTAICRHLAWMFGLSGQTPTMDTLLNMFADSIFEAQVSVFGPTDDGSDSNTSVIVDDVKLAKVCSRIAFIIEKQLTSNKTSYLTGEKITWVDLMVYVFFNSLLDYGKNVNLSKYPLVKHMYDRISQITEF